jgi:hypothetical protein
MIGNRIYSKYARGTGVSSFGMSGVNAHVLLRNNGGATRSAGDLTQPPWKHAALSVVPVRSALTSLVSIKNRCTLVRNSVALSEARSSYLLDHMVKGRAILPATGYLAICEQALASIFTRNTACLVDLRFMLPIQLDSSNVESDIQIDMSLDAVGLVISTCPGVCMTAGFVACDTLPSRDQMAEPAQLSSPLCWILSADILKASAIAALAPSTQAGRLGSGCQPDVADASLHLGAVGSPIACSRVPVAMQYVMFYQRTGHLEGQPAYAVSKARRNMMIDRQDALHDARIYQGQNLTVVGMHSKALHTGLAARREASAAPGAVDMFYSVILQTSEPAAEEEDDPSSAGPTSWEMISLAGGLATTMYGPCGRGPPSHGLAAGLALLQQLSGRGARVAASNVMVNVPRSDHGGPSAAKHHR